LLKKTITFMLIFMLIFSSFSFATDTTKQEKAAEKLVTLGLLTGYEDGSLRLENQITRSEFAALAVRLLMKDQNLDDYKKDTIFDDVKEDHWASSYINIATEEKLINGYGDGTFRPDDTITHAEVLTILVRLLGYDNNLNPEKEWPINYIQKALELGINTNDVIIPKALVTRGDVVVYIDNSLLVSLERKNGQ